MGYDFSAHIENFDGNFDSKVLVQFAENAYSRFGSYWDILGS